MRITNSILARNAQLGVRHGLSGLAEAQQRVASGLRLQRPSDDPAAAADVIKTDRRLRGLEQYQRNIAAATARLANQEDAIDQTGEILSRARELALAQAGGTANASTRAIAGAEAERLLESVVALANSRFGSGYLFGGQFAERAPLAADGSADPLHPASEDTRTEIGAGQTIATAMAAQATFVDSGTIAALQKLNDGLAGNDPALIVEAATELTSAIDKVQTRLGEVGARVRQLELAQSNAEALDTTLRGYRADLAEVDIEEAVTALMARQTSLEAALSSTARLLTTTLTDYLR